MNRSDLHAALMLTAYLLFALATRLGALGWVYAHDPGRIAYPDSASYENPARAVLQTGRYAPSPEAPARPDVMRTPGYPVLIALVYRLFGPSRAALIIVQILLSVATVGLVYDLGRRTVSRAAGLTGRRVHGARSGSFSTASDADRKPNSHFAWCWGAGPGSC
jgi:4-amino-4-deoxy-L-arabinose transferase-like glycosyltransferase